MLSINLRLFIQSIHPAHKYSKPVVVCNFSNMLDPAKLRYVTDEADAGQRAVQLAAEPVLGVDIETFPAAGYRELSGAALDPYLAHIRLVSVAALDGRVAVFDMQRLPIDVLRPLCRTNWVVFNGAFEYRHLTKVGLTVPAMHDLQLLDRLHSHKLHRRLADVVQDTLQVQLAKTQQDSDWGVAELTDQQLRYAALDALATVRAAQQLLPWIDKIGQRRLYDVWCAVLPVLSELQLQGQSFDWTAHDSLIKHWQREYDQLRQELRQHLGSDINPMSGLQLVEWLWQHMPTNVL